MKHQLIENLEPRVLLSIAPTAPKAYTMGTAGTTVIYAQYDKAHGMELYRSDGTSNGTYLLKDLYPGSKGSYPNFLATLVDKVLFSAYDGHGYALWETDGTVNGTFKTNGGSPNAYYQGPNPTPALINTVLFYIGRDHKLWRTDGSTAGTFPLTDRILNSVYASSQKLAVLNGYVYFSANDGKHGFELWRSNGTVHGTALFADVVAGAAGSNPRNIVATNDRVYFVDDIQGATKEHLWKTDGVSVKLVETASNQFSGDFAGIDQLTPRGSTLYFTEDERGQIGGADSVWKTASTAHSLKRVGNFNLPRMVAPGVGGDGGARIFFYEPGKVEGSVTAIYGAQPQKALSVVQTGLDGQQPTTIVQIRDDLYFSRPFAVGEGTELWLSEGRTPRMVKSFPHVARIAGVAVFGFIAHPKVIVATTTPSRSIVADSAGIYLSDRTTTGTVLLKDIDIFNYSTMRFDDTIFVDNHTYFVIRAPDNSWNLWVSDGTSAGTHVTREFT